MAGKKLMLATNPSGIGTSPKKIISSLEKYKITLEHLIGLEHGFLGLEEEFSQTPVTMDSTFNRPLYHIYRIKDSELRDLVREVDYVVFDVQDVGMRCYTYLSVLKRLMDAMKNTKTKLVVLDHIHVAMHLSPMGEKMNPRNLNFAGEFPSLLITGMTVGEATRFYNKEYLKESVDVLVVPVEGYKRGMYFEDTGIPWTTPSPNLPMVDSARNYLSLVLLEGVNVSVGRGTQAPFVYFGAPWMTNPEELASKLEKLGNKSYYFSPVYFKPTFGPHKGKICSGLRMNLVRPDYDPIQLAYDLIKHMKETYPNDFKWSKGSTNHWVDQLWGNEHFRTSINEGKSFTDFHKTYLAEEEMERKKIAPYLLY
ncbi:DUF1343 domain-containing protein [Leptospira sp. 2 VSF19]|uniref:DUF1343 domain-containing protein n=2 Tax=Leptospira soteropolitanensis TaxID=2950025 RepID=A0AAW5VFP6_9LEPT|nr:DUF1343 domain-containing protein [Leptospira soteropolitanensis]MCW7522920.1 DUF1343 domain-containing protein [Leptospira soteropolitanensis]MCW7526973.1 DUF1343 domain-containing protein [Leptospira soteropolitanensis]MCW7530638.1 DUF1343 domain-containing protein [Leptospira soteropolitanensis]